MFADKIPQLEKFFTDLPQIVANHASNFFDKSWTNKGFTDKTLKKWKPVIDPKTGKTKGRPLVKSSRLRRSIRKEVSANEITLYTEVPYAELHNEGGKVKGKFKVNEHYRKNKYGGRSKVKTHSRNVNHEMPQRQFIGQSDTLDQEVLELIDLGLHKILG